MVVCAAALIFYKYAQFLSVQFVGLFLPSVGNALSVAAKSIHPGAPPLAISFFVFEFVHYLFDVRKGQLPIKNPFHFAAFSVFWPSIVAGPIKRFEQFVPAMLKGLSSVSANDKIHGLLRVMSGVLKKILADNLTMWIDYYGPQFETLDIMWRWIFVVVLALRIYWDFSGYSDMAIGYARMMGISLPENFNWPYIAKNIEDFWRRWHISLSSWIRDYVYIPLGGANHGRARKLANVMIAFSLCGLWHGANWNFVLWGLYHGVGLVICATYGSVLGGAGRRVAAVFRRLPGLGTFVTFWFVSFSWILFFYPAPVAAHMIRLLVAVG
jgi:alginate O-acetyltransferase complex protein AlgI